MCVWALMTVLSPDLAFYCWFYSTHIKSHQRQKIEKVDFFNNGKERGKQCLKALNRVCLSACLSVSQFPPDHPCQSVFLSHHGQLSLQLLDAVLLEVELGAQHPRVLRGFLGLPPQVPLLSLQHVFLFGQRLHRILALLANTEILMDWFTYQAFLWETVRIEQVCSIIAPNPISDQWVQSIFFPEKEKGLNCWFHVLLLISVFYLHHVYYGNDIQGFPNM